MLDSDGRTTRVFRACLLASGTRASTFKLGQSVKKKSVGQLKQASQSVSQTVSRSVCVNTGEQKLRRRFGCGPFRGLPLMIALDEKSLAQREEFFLVMDIPDLNLDSRTSQMSGLSGGTARASKLRAAAAAKKKKN